MLALVWIFCCPLTSQAHPLGNFTINHFTRIEVGSQQIKLHYVVDMAEIPTFQELQAITGQAENAPSESELTAYTQRAVAGYAERLIVTLDGSHIPLSVISKQLKMLPGAGGMQTLRIECDLAGLIPAHSNASPHRVLFEDNNYQDRIGWREIVVSPIAGLSIFNSSAFANSISNELKSYPEDLLAAPLDERKAELSFVAGSQPAGTTALRSRDGRVAAPPARDRLAELIAVPVLTPATALLGLLMAVLLGGLHAMSPGHGKTVVGAYLIGSRGTARHAAFLGLTVTITHTAGVFALGLATLLASEYVLPERLYPFLSLISGAIVVAIGLTLLVRRLRAAMGVSSHSHIHSHHGYTHTHSDADADHVHDHEHGVDPTQPHSHGGRVHSHLPPGADDSPITWRTLLALGISGGILPCPSALVVLLAAISLHRVGYGLLLVIAFSFGLAGVLTGVGLAFVYAGRLFKPRKRLGALTRVLPVLSALVITIAGGAICYGALGQAGLSPSIFLAQMAARFGTAAQEAQPVVSVGALGVLGLGLVYGLKHATEVDHIVAVSAIVSEHRKLVRAAFVGGLWGVGHTAALIVVGAAVLVLRIAIPERVATWLEFGVALMIIGLGLAALRKALRSRTDFHIHKHAHGGEFHAHAHFHEHGSEHADLPDAHSHAVTRMGFKPALVGAAHGLAGSGALTLLVLTQIGSPLLGILYLGVFGMGSIIGMLLMSGLVGLPFVIGARKLNGIHYRLQMAAGALSIAFGIWYAYETGIASGLMRSLTAV